MKKNLRNARGFSLVEVVLALGITAFALIVILALLPAGLGANQVSIQQTEAVNLSTAIVADLRQTPTTAQIAASGGSLTAVSPRYGINVVTTATPTPTATTFYLDPSGNSSTTLAAASRYKITVTFNPFSGTRKAVCGSVVVSWPAAAAAPLSSVSTFIALDRN